MRKKSTKLTSDALTRALSGEAPESTELTEVLPEPQAVETPEPAKPEPEAPKVEAKTETVPAVVPTVDPLVAHLKEELKEARASNGELNAKVSDLTAGNKALQAKLDASEAFSVEASVALRKMTERLSIGLGVKVVGVEAAQGDNLLLLFASTLKTFDSRFPTGGKSSSSATEEKDQSQGKSSLQETRRVKATRV